MKQFLAFLQKEFRHMVRDWRTLLILVAMPVVMVLLFGYAITTEVKGTRTAIFDGSKDYLTCRITNALAANKYFTLTASCQSMNEVETLFRKGEIDMAIIFAPSFAEELGKADNALGQLLIDGSEPNQAAVRQGYVMQLIASTLQEAVSSAQQLKSPQINVHTRMLYNPQGRSEFNFVPAVIGMILLLLCTMMTSISIVREKEMGTMEVLLASPLPPTAIVAAKLVPYFAVSVVNLITILLLSRFLLSVPIAGSLTVFVGVALLYIMVALALGLLISTLVRTQLAAMLFSLLMIVPTMYLSGMVFQIDSMPVPAQYMSAIVPARWFMDAARRLMIQGVEARYILKNVAALATELIVLLALSVKLFKTRLE